MCFLRIVLTTVTAIDVGVGACAGDRIEIRAFWAKGNVRMVRAAVVETNTVDSTNVVAKVIEVSVETTLDGTLFGCGVTIALWERLEGVGNIVDRPTGTSAVVVISTGFEQTCQSARKDLACWLAFAYVTIQSWSGR